MWDKILAASLTVKFDVWAEQDKNITLSLFFKFELEGPS